MSSIKISVITISYNQCEFIEQAITSVQSQTYKNVEHIVIDGRSEDGTREILEKYPHLKWISEKDRGQSDAYNKALSMIDGDLVLFLNSDDYLLTPTVFEDVVKKIETTEVDKYSVYMGNLYVVDRAGNKIDEMNNRNRDYTFETLLNELPVIIHPASFFVRKVIVGIKGYDENIHYQMDYDYFLKASKLKPVHSIAVYTSALRRHDSSKGGGEDSWKFSWEFLKIRWKYGAKLFCKLNIHPLKVLIRHFILGERLYGRLKQSLLANKIVEITGLKKINKLTWFEKK